MNSTEEIRKYSDFPPALTRRISYDYPEKSPKKDKKWSFGRLFRIRKKNASESSSGDEGGNKKKKKKASKKKRNPKMGTFDHVVVRPKAAVNGYKSFEEAGGILSEPSFSSSSLAKSNSTTTHRDARSRHWSPDCSRKDGVKARAEARRDRSICESSDEDSQRSASSRFRSDESLSKHKEGSLSRRSRAARTERYLKRLSHSEENRENAKASKSDIEPDRLKPGSRIPPSRSPILTNTAKSQPVVPVKHIPVPYSAISSHATNPKYRTINLGAYTQYRSYQDSGNKTSNNNNCLSPTFDAQRSVSCDADIHASPSPTNAEILHAQFSLGKPFTSRQRQQLVINQQNEGIKQPPPPPPPRDPRRIVSAQHYDTRPISFAFETGYASSHAKDVAAPLQPSNLNPKCRSTSEDHISSEPLQRVPLVPRPSSATPETNRIQRFHYARKFDEDPASFRYLTDKQPRSRKPITIQSCAADSSNLSLQKSRSQKTFDFWRQKEEAMAARSQSVNKNARKSTPTSPTTVFTAQTHVKTTIFPRESSPFRPITPSDCQLKSTILVADATKMQSPQHGSEKPKNLEDALDELEAIYNSLHLGDEDLLDRAEKREADAVQKRKDAIFDSFPNAAQARTGGFEPNYELRKKRYMKRSDPDRRGDDMAFRKLNKERSKTISDPQAVVAKVSYLLSSPLYKQTPDERSGRKSSREPDITFDDVVYRNIKHTVNSLKVQDPQPPFGIPLGPLTPGANSDYLHADPDTAETYKSSKIPDVVKDDLAYRNLRKDPNKEPALPASQITSDDYINNNNRAIEMKSSCFVPVKKKRAVRSMSANLFNTMQREWEESLLGAHLEKDNGTKESISDVADALEIARQILKEKDEKIRETRKAFMSDGETKYRRYGSKMSDNFMNDTRMKGNGYRHKVQVTVPLIDRLDCTRPPTTSSPNAVKSTENTDPSLDQLLTDLAVEARETSEQIGNELRLLNEEMVKSDVKQSASVVDINKTLDEIDTVGEELCKKISQSVKNSETARKSDARDSPPLSSHEDAIDTKKTLGEIVVIDVRAGSEQYENQANNSSEHGDKLEEEQQAPRAVAEVSESEHDYENIHSESELNKSELQGSHVEETEEKERELEQLLAINDAKVAIDLSPMEKHRDEIVASFQQINEQDAIERSSTADRTSKTCKTEQRSSGNHHDDVMLPGDEDEGERCVTNVRCVALLNGECASTTLHLRDLTDGSHDDSNVGESGELDSLKSPRLVQRVEWATRANFERGNNPGDGNGSSACSGTLRHTLDSLDAKELMWWREPYAIVPFACASGLACTEFASLDHLTLLGLVCVVLLITIAFTLHR